VLVGALIIVVAGAICFWVIDRFAADGRLKKLLRPLVVLVPWGNCAASIDSDMLAVPPIRSFPSTGNVAIIDKNGGESGVRLRPDDTAEDVH
jgi:hypothetical protein